MSTEGQLARAAEQNRLARRDIEARDRALRVAYARLTAVREAIQMRNYGSAEDRIYALLDYVSDEFGVPLIVADAEESMRRG